MDIEKACQELTKGDPQAIEFCLSILCWFHVLDDLIDKDKAVSPAQVVQAQLKLWSVLSFNQFYQQHKCDLWPIVVTSATSYIDSERFKAGDDVRAKLAAEVLKSDYQNILWFVAYLVGGSTFMQEMTAKYREFDFG